MNLDLLEGAVLSKGKHYKGPETCALELIHLVVTGEKDDSVPECLSETLSILPILNDGPWRDDAHRTSVLLPYLRRLLDCPKDEEVDQRRVFALADYAVRKIAQVNCPLVVDEESALQASKLAGFAAEERGEEISYWASQVAKWAPDWVGQSAEWAGWATRQDEQESADVFESHARALLEIICETK